MFIRSCISATLAVGLLMTASSASAAVIGFTNFADFQNAAIGDASVIDFDAFGGGQTIGTIGDVTFGSSGAGLAVYITDPDFNIIFNPNPTDTVSRLNYVGSSNFAFRELTDESISLSFGAGRSAVGVFVIAPTNNGVSLTAGGSTIGAGLADPGFTLTGANNAFFIGLVDTTGANSITSASFGNLIGGTGYFFDDVVSYQAVAIPEPGSIMALTVLGGFALIRRRKKTVRAGE